MAETGSPPIVDARSIWMRFHRERSDRAENIALADVSFRVDQGEFVSLVGPSGCGKTTMLNIASGLLTPTAGTVSVAGVTVKGPGRDRAMVFQDAALLPWRSVLGNVVYGVECQGRNTKTIMPQALDLIELVGLKGFEKYYPHELSGGMRQRVNLARALLTDPDVLLMDEPFAALDAQTREVMQGELLRIWSQTRKTVLFVTHQIEEAVYLSDRVLVFGTHPGRILEDVQIEVPRPRPLSLKREDILVRYERHIWSLIRPSREADDGQLEAVARPS